MSTTAPSAYPIRRRPRLCKTCLPCRASKVRCDRNLPCGNCAKRNFTCSYSQAPLSTGATIPHLPPQSQSQSQQPPSTLLPSLQQHIIQREICPRNNPYPSVTVTPSDTSIPSARFTPDQSRFQYAAGNYEAGMDCDGVVGDDEGDDDDEDEDDPSDTVNISQAEWEDIHTKMGAMEQILNSLHLLFQSHSGRLCKGPEPPPPPPPPSTSSPSTSSIKESPPAKTETDRERRHSPQVGNIFRPSPLLKKGTIHIGPRSALVDIFNKSKTSDDTARALPKDDLLAELALGNQSVAYPFVDLWSSDPFTFNIVAVCDVLPVDVQCHRFFDYYKNIGAVLYPVLSDIAQVEQSVQQLLRNRAAAGGGYHPDDNGLVKPFGMSLGFLSLLFAILASGCQLSDLSASERELTSWVYVSCSYQCLRMMNYVAQPTVEVIQILLIISNVLSYNMNAGASYTLLGMTERMCMVLGLHVETPGFSRSEQAVRRKIWWTMAFQNSHFSLAYDRPSITMISQPEIPYDRKSMPGHRSYFESLCRVVSLALEVLRRRLDPEHSHVRYHDIREYKQRMHRILAEAAPHLRFADRCATIADNIERTELRLHSCYLISVLCRVSLDPDSHLDGNRRALVREDCIANLIGTIEAFVELHSINHHCSRSWISVQRAIACAFLLVAHDGQSHPQTHFLIQKLQDVLADHVYADGAVAHNSRTDSAKHLATSLRALREISAAFQARQMRTPPDSGVVSKSDTPNITVTVPATSGSMMVNPGMAAPAMPGYGQGQSYAPMEYEYPDMRNILDQVSDVMLFPSMSE